MGYLDLHMHSLYSDDGEFQPRELVDLCLANGVKYFSIADHNSVGGIAEAKEYCKDKGVTIIPAVELDCTVDSTNLHVLGYGIDYHSRIFKEIEESIILQEQTASIERIKLVRKLGINFSDEVIKDLTKNGVVNGEMIAEAALGFDNAKDNPLLRCYFPGGSRSDNPFVNFYWDYCAQGKAAYVPIHFISLREAVRMIEQTGGIPVLAHPGNNVKEDKALLENIVSAGIKGLECYSSYHTLEQIAFYKEFAVRNKLIMTCGSDFHGKTKPSIKIGCVQCDSNEESMLVALKTII